MMIRFAVILALYVCCLSAYGDWRRGLLYNGTDESVSAGDVPEFDSTTKLTMSVWIYPNALSDFDGIVQKYLDGSRRFALQLSGGGGGGNNDISVTINATAKYTLGNIVTTGSWQHYTVVYDGTKATAGDRTAIYKNGVYISNTSSGGSTPASLSDMSGGTVTVGNDIHNSGRFFNGTITAPLVYNRALSAEEIGGLCNLAVANTNDGASLEVPRAWVDGTNTLFLDLDMSETWDTGATVTNGTHMINNGAASGTATITGTPDVSAPFQTPSPHR